MELPGRSDDYEFFWIKTSRKSSEWLQKWGELHNPDPSNPHMTSTFIRKVWNTVGQDAEKDQAIETLASGTGHSTRMARKNYLLKKDKASAMAGKKTIEAFFGEPPVDFPEDAELTKEILHAKCMELASFFPTPRGYDGFIHEENPDAAIRKKDGRFCAQNVTSSSSADPSALAGQQKKRRRTH